ncbi:polysaccharide pyruvyl transferase family protein (plasmid) [Rhizobium sp. WW22]|uniref:polysaccharide pyruvyl transferase family protein n=1 Tax=unclassified Rhizobium TaxID=2613769 RepID=UPI0013AF253B|nr:MULTISPECIES: polysaccharide pyruvyl transferase family protein [unclassified Rhizobium]MBB3387222.1 hypothetical protein [Rhizobium sp. BK098]MBB3618924.1 hypothetical protein [Rhizobium sp. BK609]MBB3684582.1 hypothetical protein [Rhizobium sp. BK612]
MGKILNLHRLNSRNIGDLKSSPFEYFDIPGWTVEYRDILDAVDPTSRDGWEVDFDTADCVVIGGGGLLDIDYFAPALTEIYRRRRNQKFVVWGAGHNHYTVGAWNQLHRSVDLIPYNYDLIGLRDADQIYHWAPCPSCMDPAFDRSYDITKKYVLYKHVEMELNEYILGILPENIYIIDNYTPFDEAIFSLGSAELVLTSSFHGAYWATLLRKRVVAFPFSSKFYSFRHQIPLCDVRDWARFVGLARAYSNALAECREANIVFRDRFLELLSR